MNLHSILKTLAYITFAIIIQTHCYVLLAGNRDDFRMLAKQLIPLSLADQIADLADKSGVLKRKTDDTLEYDSIDDEEDREEEQTKLKYAPINFDALMRKLKDQVAKALKVASKENHKLKPEYSDEETTTDRKNIQKQMRKPRGIKRQEKKNKPRQQDGDLTYTKIEMNGKDSYEDYVIPKKEDDIFEYDDIDNEKLKDTTKKHSDNTYNEKHDKPKKHYNDADNEKKYDLKPIKHNVDADNEKHYDKPKKHSDDADNEKHYDKPKNRNDHTDDDKPKKYNNDALNNKLKLTPKTKQHTPEYENYDAETEKLDENPKNTNQDIESREVAYNDKEEYKAITGDLSYEDKQMNATDEDSADATTPMERKGGRKTTKRNKGTNIPKRDFYKLSSPNYAAKVPIVAEKYNFDEPIPEKDREPENLEPVKGLPLPSIINGRIRLREQKFV